MDFALVYARDKYVHLQIKDACLLWNSIIPRHIIFNNKWYCVSLCFIRKKIKPFEGLLNWVCVDTSFVDKQFPGFLPMKRVQLSIHNAYMDHTLFLYQSLYMHWIKMKNPLYELDKLIINNVLILKKKWCKLLYMNKEG